MAEHSPCEHCGHARRSHAARYVLYATDHHGLFDGMDEPFGRCRFCECWYYHDPGLRRWLARLGQQIVCRPPAAQDARQFFVVPLPAAPPASEEA